MFIFKTVESLQRILNVRIEDIISPMIKKEVKVKSSGASNNLFCSHSLSFASLAGANYRKQTFLINLKKSIQKQPPEAA